MTLGTPELVLVLIALANERRAGGLVVDVDLGLRLSPGSRAEPWVRSKSRGSYGCIREELAAGVTMPRAHLRADRSPVVGSCYQITQDCAGYCLDCKQNQNCPCRRASSGREPWSRFATVLFARFVSFEISGVLVSVSAEKKPRACAEASRCQEKAP
jgi:hypothetical protein